METYVMLTKLTDEGRKTLKEKPNRTKRSTKRSRGWAAGSSASTRFSGHTTTST